MSQRRHFQDIRSRGFFLLMKKVEIQRNVNAINELSLAQCLSFEFLVVFILQSENALSSFPEKRIFCKLVQAFY